MPSQTLLEQPGSSIELISIQFLYHFLPSVRLERSVALFCVVEILKSERFSWVGHGKSG